MSRAQIDIPDDKIAEFCRRNRIKRLALFGSVLRDDLKRHRMLQHALVQVVEIVGEAAARVSEAGQQRYPSIPL